jgi:two-component system, cell cycle sensor histidine kinase and response regulator CckA
MHNLLLSIAVVALMALVISVLNGVRRSTERRHARSLEALERDRRRLEAELRQAQKLEAIGHLAGGVAHDFNNILMVIQGYSDMLLAEAPESGTTRSDLREIQEAARRGTDLTRQLLAFGRKQVLTIRPLDLNAVLADTSHMLTRLIGESVRLELRNATEACRIEADRVQLEQVLINLAVNARDAMSARGTLSVALDRVTVETETRDVPPGEYVRLTVSDTGCGMDQDTRDRMFEPFFTTKAAGKGSGLGLSTVYGVVKQLGGHIAVDSAPLQGTTFTIHFPATARPVAARREAKATQVASGRSETVLLVEDDRAVRTVVNSVLRRHGYAVLEADGPKEALSAARQHAGAIDLVLSDVIMPEMSGPEMVTLLAERHPETRAIYLSGYSADTLVRDGLLGTRARLVQKPVAPRDLLHAVRAALGTAPRGPVPIRLAS